MSGRRGGRRVDPSVYRALDLRAHSFLSDVPLHDVWEVALSAGGPYRTLSDVRALMTTELASASSAPVRMLFALRGLLGRLLRLDRERPRESSDDSLASRLTADDRARTRVPTGTRDGPFRVLYFFDDEAVSEVRNATVHAFSVMALKPGAEGYTLYWAIYVRPIGLITPLYMALIDPFRRLVVYPSITRQLQRAWSAVAHDAAGCDADGGGGA